MHIRKQRLLTPGPTPLYPPALHAMMASDIHHRTEDFRKVYRSALAGWEEAGRSGKPRYIGAFYVALGPEEVVARGQEYMTSYYGAGRPPQSSPQAILDLIHAHADIGMDVNIGLMLLNLLPLPPLDGGRIAVSLLPYRQAVAFAQLERWGFPILLLLLFSGILSSILYPLMGAMRYLFAVVFNFQA